jgi:hypothetical protein
VSHVLALIKSGAEEGFSLLLEMTDMIKSTPILSPFHSKLWEVLNGHNIFEAIYTLIKNMNLSLEERKLAEQSQKKSKSKDEVSKSNSVAKNLKKNTSNVFGLGKSAIGNFITSDDAFKDFTEEKVRRIEGMSLELLIASLENCP